jgi:hypothetical protein
MMSASDRITDLSRTSREVRKVPNSEVAELIRSPRQRGPLSQTALSQPRITCDVLRKMFRVFADAVQKCGLEFVEPWQAEKIDARYSCDPALVFWHSVRRLCPACKYWEVNPTEVIRKPICPNDSGDVSLGEIKGQDGIGDFRRVA